MYPRLFLSTRGELPFETPHPSQHRVDILKDLVRRGVIQRCLCGLFESRFHRCALFLDVEMGDFEVLAEKLEGEAEEGLVLDAWLILYFGISL